MTPRLDVAALCVVVAAGCGGYWHGRPKANTAPSSWQASPASGAPGVVAGSGSTLSIQERFENLETLRRSGLISEAEYRERRQEILDESFDPR